MSEIERQFNSLLNEYKTQKPIYSSNIRDYVSLPSFQAICDLGKSVVPLIIKEYEREIDFWDVALSQILDFHPNIPQDQLGRVEYIRAAWVSWYYAKYGE